MFLAVFSTQNPPQRVPTLSSFPQCLAPQVNHSELTGGPGGPWGPGGPDI